MGASQDWGKVVHADEQYVQSTDNVEVLKIYKNKTDGEWYYKNHLGQSFPFNFNLNLKTYKAVFALPTEEGEPSARIIQNNLGFVPTWTRIGVGQYFSSNPQWNALGPDKIFILVSKSSLTPVGYFESSFNIEDGGIKINTYNSSGVLSDGLLSDGDGFSRSFIEITIKQ